MVNYGRLDVSSYAVRKTRDVVARVFARVSAVAGGSVCLRAGLSFAGPDGAERGHTLAAGCFREGEVLPVRSCDSAHAGCSQSGCPRVAIDPIRSALWKASLEARRFPETLCRDRH